ncbi:unnamed protein product [Prunus brigantina]
MFKSNKKKKEKLNTYIHLMVLEFKSNDPLYFTNAMAKKIAKMVKKYAGYTGDNNVVEATYSSNIISTAEKLTNSTKLTKGQRLKVEQQRLAALKVITRQGATYVTTKEQVLAPAECQYKKKEGEDEPVDEDEKLGHKSPEWKDWKWDGDKVIVSKDLKVEKADIRRAAKWKSLKFEEWAGVDLLKK